MSTTINQTKKKKKAKKKKTKTPLYRVYPRVRIHAARRGCDSRKNEKLYEKEK